MASIFDNAITAGLTARRSIAGQTVAYSDGSNSGSVSAVRGKPVMKLSDALLVQMSERYVDWMISSADLAAIAPSLTMPPDRGHTITVNGDEYTVTSFEGTPAWSWVDAGETEYRIHTIKTGDA